MKNSFSDNLSYKFVALGVAFILWLSMMGSRDSTLSKEFELQILTGSNIEMVGSVPNSVKVEVAGPRIALKKVNGMNPVFTVDLTGAHLGRQVVRLNRDSLSLPLGAHLIGLEPREFTIVLREAATVGSEGK